MADIVMRLRTSPWLRGSPTGDMLLDAANEIKQLRQQLELTTSQLDDALTKNKQLHRQYTELRTLWIATHNKLGETQRDQQRAVYNLPEQ